MGVTSGASQFMTTALFIQGFWFEAHLVHGRLWGSFDCNQQLANDWSRFWSSWPKAALLPQNCRQSFLPSISLLQGLPNTEKRSLSGASYLVRAYTFLPSVAVLRNVDMFFPSHETTFTVDDFLDEQVLRCLDVAIGGDELRLTDVHRCEPNTQPRKNIAYGHLEELTVVVVCAAHARLVAATPRWARTRRSFPAVKYNICKSLVHPRVRLTY